MLHARDRCEKPVADQVHERNCDSCTVDNNGQICNAIRKGLNFRGRILVHIERKLHRLNWKLGTRHPSNGILSI